MSPPNWIIKLALSIQIITFSLLGVYFAVNHKPDLFIGCFLFVAASNIAYAIRDLQS